MPWFVVRKRRVVRRRTSSAKSKQEFTELAPLARTLAHARLQHYNRHYHLTYNKVFIRNTRTRWGTCSALGNLSFNYRIVKLPQELADYVVVHELCHLAHLNHSAAFWARVAEVLPNWKHLRKELQKHRLG